MIGRWITELRRRHHLKLAIEQLERLDDRMLFDIGLARGTILSAVLGAERQAQRLQS